VAAKKLQGQLLAALKNQPDATNPQTAHQQRIKV
jgi:hypothetical protein